MHAASMSTAASAASAHAASSDSYTVAPAEGLRSWRDARSMKADTMSAPRGLSLRDGVFATGFAVLIAYAIERGAYGGECAGASTVAAGDAEAFEFRPLTEAELAQLADANPELWEFAAGLVAAAGPPMASDDVAMDMLAMPEFWDDAPIEVSPEGDFLYGA